MKKPDIEQHIAWNGDGSYAPTCELCGWRGKDRLNHTDTRAAVLAHQRTKRHRAVLAVTVTMPPEEGER